MLVDVLAYDQPAGGVSYRACEAGRGPAIVAAHRREGRRQRLLRLGVLAVGGLLLAGYGVLTRQPLLAVGSVVAVVVLAVASLVVGSTGDGDPVPTLVEESLRVEDATRRYDLDVTPA